jgi:hypothetical protein
VSARLAVGLVLVVTGCSTAQADDRRPMPGVPASAYPATSAPAQVASASESPSASASAAPSASNLRSVPATDVDPIPAERSQRPAKGDWESAPLAAEARVTEPGCKVQRLREWYRIHCKHLFIQLVAGTREEVEFGGYKSVPDSFSHDEVWAVFPARRGDRRLFQLYRWSKWAPGEPDAHGSEQWLEGDPLPLITVQGLRWGI